MHVLLAGALVEQLLGCDSPSWAAQKRQTPRRPVCGGSGRDL